MNHEARVVSALLKNNDMPAIMGDNVMKLMETYGDVWGFIQQYYDMNKELPPPLLVEQEFTTDNGEKQFEFDPEILGATRHHVESLKEYRRSEMLQAYLTGALKTAKDKKKSVADIIARVNKKMSELERTTGISRAVDMLDVENAAAHYDKVRELAKQHGGRPGISTGFEYWDDRYPTGMAPGHFVVIMGYSGKGKTWFAIKMAINAWEQNFNVLMINLEMRPEELRDRIYFLISNYTMDDLVKAEIDPDQFTAWAKDYMEGKTQFNLVTSEGGEFTTSMVQAKIEQFKPDLVVCDYMQLFYDKNLTQQDTARAKNASTEFKRVAMNTEVPIVLISAVTGKDKKDRDNPPEIAQLAWSSQLEYDANICMAVHTNNNPITGKAESTEIVCRKNRHGPLFAFRVKMDLTNGIIEELPPEIQEKFLDREDSKLADIFDEDMPANTKIMSVQQEMLEG